MAERHAEVRRPGRRRLSPDSSPAPTRSAREARLEPGREPESWCHVVDVAREIELGVCGHAGHSGARRRRMTRRAPGPSRLRACCLRATIGDSFSSFFDAVGAFASGLAVVQWWALARWPWSSLAAYLMPAVAGLVQHPARRLPGPAVPLAAHLRRLRGRRRHQRAGPRARRRRGESMPGASPSTLLGADRGHAAGRAVFDMAVASVLPLACTRAGCRACPSCRPPRPSSGPSSPATSAGS